MARVTTVIAAYNAEQTIAPTIDSALTQTYKDNEVMIVDDGSTDSTPLILRGFGDRIRVITQTNRGAAAARNAGVAHSAGDYVAFLDSDDLWMPWKLSTMVPALQRNPAASLAFSEYGNFSQAGAEWGASSLGHAPSMEELMDFRPLPILTSTWVTPKQTFERTGGFCEAFKGAPGFEDRWLLLLLRELGPFEYVPAKLTRYRVAENCESADKYGPGLAVFVSLAKERYGSRGKALICGAKNLKCRWMLSKMAHQMDRGDRLGALISLAHIARIRPAYLLGSELAGRLRLPQNIKRIRALTIGRPTEMRG
jgi:glycosyltransferase involved in cell wall biosynthesis